MNERILFLGGEQATAEGVHSFLIGMGYRVLLETSGMDGLLLFAKKARLFDLIVADISMPDISGLLLVRKFLEIRPDIPIILLTGEDGHAQSEARHTGVEWFGIKPLSMPDLAGTIRRALATTTPAEPDTLAG